ncbi:hypothetical protein QYE76_049510 [Lolium multiflorum]|uniref:KNOX1 domain-containing protein n=1 Tax=Lolium multiflorum TaxID=4521 RepID=A0AAD8SN81_LOLMU|nr:hypothetical protein QYE76_049510 [Lolium multiflorum]
MHGDEMGSARRRIPMEDLYSIHPGISRGGGGGAACSEASGVAGSPPTPPPAAAHPSTPDLTKLMKAQIAGHPRYPSLLSAYIECRKVGAPPEVAALLEEIGRPKRRSGGAAVERRVRLPATEQRGSWEEGRRCGGGRDYVAAMVCGARILTCITRMVRQAVRRQSRIE